MVHIQVSNHSTVVTHDEFQRMVVAVDYQVTHDFAPLWHTSALVRASAPPKGHPWQIGLFDTSDEAQALGYHTLTRDGRPAGFVAAKDTLDDGQSVSSVLSHEVLEMLADPLCNRAAQDSDSGEFVAYEVSDPVQDSTYEIDGVTVSNFVGPAWFQRGSWGRLDHLGELFGPFELATGGYISVYGGEGWSQRFGSTATGKRMKARKRLGPREELRRRK